MPSMANFCANIGCACVNPGPQGPPGPPGPVDIRYHVEDGADVGDPGLSSTHSYVMPAPAGRRFISGSYRFRTPGPPGTATPPPTVEVYSALVASDGSSYEVRFNLAAPAWIDVTAVSVPIP